MRALAFAAAAIFAGCGEAPDTSALDAAYGPWKQRNFILGQTFSGGATLDGLVLLDAGSRRKGDWMELSVNGNAPTRTTESQAQPSVMVEVTRIRYEVKLRPGPNWIRFFSSASRLGWEFQVDARQGTHFTFTPKNDTEYEVTQVKEE